MNMMTSMLAIWTHTRPRVVPRVIFNGQEESVSGNKLILPPLGNETSTRITSANETSTVTVPLVLVSPDMYSHTLFCRVRFLPKNSSATEAQPQPTATEAQFLPPNPPVFPKYYPNAPTERPSWNRPSRSWNLPPPSRAGTPWEKIHMMIE